MPFGEDVFAGIGGRTGDSGQKYSSTTDDIRQKFTGYQKDPETSLDFAEARMYQNRFGRFTAIDPLLASGKSANPQSFNRYIYVLNNPLFFADPTGLIWGRAEDGRVRWFDRKLGKGFSEFTPENWQYVGKGGVIIELDPNSSKSWEIRPVEVVAEINPIQQLAASISDGVDDSFSGAGKGGANFCIKTWNFFTQPGYWGGEALGIPNPFAISPFEYKTPTERKFGTAVETGLMLAPSAAGAPFAAYRVPSAIPDVILSPSQRALKLGVEGENAVGITGPKERIPSLTKTAEYRIPDRTTPATIEEVKNVSRLSYTRQIQDYHLYAQTTNKQLIIHARPTTCFSGPLQKLINEGSILVQPIP